MSEQLDKWTGEFGDEYHKRNCNTYRSVMGRVQVWKDIAQYVPMIGSYGYKYYSSSPVFDAEKPMTILEVGAGTGANLLAIKHLKTAHTLIALEPNYEAVQILRDQHVTEEIMHMSWMDYVPIYKKVDLVFTYGVLIHVDPKERKKFMQKIIDTSSRYVVCCEYFSPTCRQIDYHGNKDMLWLDNYGGIYKDMGLKILSCKFYSKLLTGLDDITCWVMEKQ